MSKQSEIEAARAKIQEELTGKTLLRVNYASLKKNDHADPDTTYRFFLSAGWYRDEPFHCVDCGKLQIWTAAQQKWWYEVAKGSALQVATRCRSCRRIHREKRETHIAKTIAGYGRKDSPKPSLPTPASATSAAGAPVAPPLGTAGR